MRKSHNFRPDGLWLVTGAAALWGTIGIATQTIYNMDNTTSLFINLARMLVATPVLLVACWHVVGQAMFDIRRRDFFVMVLAGILLAASQAAYFAAIRASGVTIPTLLTICIAPLIVSGLSVLLRLETLTGRVLVSLGCALAGSVLLVGLSSPESGQDQLLLGTLLSIVSAAGYAGMILCGRFVAADYHPLQITTVTFCAGALVLVPVNLLNGVVTVQTSQGWLLVVYLGLVPTALAYWLFQKGLRSVSATVASIASMFEPLVAALLAWALFGETLALSGLLGAALLLVSIFLLPGDPG